MIIFHGMLAIRDAQCSISSMRSSRLSGAVHGPDHCTINSSPPGVSRGLGSDGSTARVSGWKVTISMNKMCHWAIIEINPRSEDVPRITAIHWAPQRPSWMEHLFQNHQFQPVWLGRDPRAECTSFSQHCGLTTRGNIYPYHHHHTDRRWVCLDWRKIIRYKDITTSELMSKFQGAPSLLHIKVNLFISHYYYYYYLVYVIMLKMFH